MSYQLFGNYHFRGGFSAFPHWLPINQCPHCGSFFTKSSKAVNSKSIAPVCMCRVIAVTPRQLSFSTFLYDTQDSCMTELFTLTPSGCLYQLILNKYRYLRNKLKIQLAIYIFNFVEFVFCYFIFSRKKRSAYMQWKIQIKNLQFLYLAKLHWFQKTLFPASPTPNCRKIRKYNQKVICNRSFTEVSLTQTIILTSFAVSAQPSPLSNIIKDP